jgi:hypothetical protein
MDEEILPSMRAELAAWNDGAGIDLAGWTGCSGNFSLAVGYADLFWPRFVAFEEYILREKFSLSSLRDFERAPGSTPQSVEWLMNHRHIADLQFYGCADISLDKVARLAHVLVEIHQAKLAWQFPQRPCVVEYLAPENPDDLMQHQISFYQRRDGAAG